MGQGAIVVIVVGSGGEVGDDACGHNDAQGHLGQSISCHVGPALLQSLLAIGYQGVCAAGCHGPAHQGGVGQVPAPGAQLYLALLTQGIADAGPQQLFRGLGDDLGVDEGVQGAAGGIEVVLEAVVRVVEHANGGDGGTVGGNGGEGEQRLVQLLGHIFAGVYRPAAAYGEDHIRIFYLVQSGHHVAVFIGGVAAVPDGLRQGQSGARYGCGQLVIGLAQSRLAAHHGGGASIAADDGENFLVAVGAHAPGGQAIGVGVHDLCSFSENEIKKQPRPKKT